MVYGVVNQIKIAETQEEVIEKIKKAIEELEGYEIEYIVPNLDGSVSITVKVKEERQWQRKNTQ